MDNEIKLLKNNDHRTDTDLEWLQEFYEFLQGKQPETIRLGKGYAPKLKQKKAFAIIWYLQEHFPVFPDQIERCDVCGELFDSHSEGIYWESKGKNFCGGCDYQVPKNYDRGKR
jgi:hypothetical protein